MALSSRVILALFFASLIVPVCFGAAPSDSAGVAVEEDAEAMSRAKEEYAPAAPQDDAVEGDEALAELEGKEDAAEGESVKIMGADRGALYHIQPLVKQARSFVRKNKPAAIGGGVAAALALITLSALLFSGGSSDKSSAPSRGALPTRVAFAAKNKGMMALGALAAAAAVAALYFLSNRGDGLASPPLQ
ncbi:hypothetical protein NCLIV_056200 [Neospora caninum Liverpool]|uniref:Transmembrane protein n=1 Tax=Neospora caninum (strain Liverpool) TaxID=572307 RepID=F0VNA0_NEOCL|nr:hypothetical protein NCLIV_056200 [Neospora caninum Liverpool]CBZ55196.1 hypothetical protein NCLIV_056200 [Neospora caninum Liverpool]CEL69923.1 TPA: hypothetical protein BN1204_056200 [Neospora caninum Liverpool]|eukprot:XP_003885224.1 hypothetical protein NCLIV_056200 [Neospora caninum Liverpool]